MGDPKEQRALWSALFTLKKRAKLLIFPQEVERLRCMVLIHLVKINTLKIRWNLSYSIFKYKYNSLGKIPTVMVTAGNSGENPPRPIVTPRQVTAMAIAANEIQTIQRMSWISIKISNVIITTYVKRYLGVKKCWSDSKHYNARRVLTRRKRPWALSLSHLFCPRSISRKEHNFFLLQNRN